MALTAMGAENGSAVCQVPLGDAPGQRWEVTKTGDTVKIKEEASGKLLDVMMEGSSDGTLAQIWDDVDGPSQQWKPAGRVYKAMVHAASGKALDIRDISLEAGAPAQIWEALGGENQQWRFVAVMGQTSATSVSKASAARSGKKTQEKAPPKRAGKKAAAAKGPKMTQGAGNTPGKKDGAA